MAHQLSLYDGVEGTTLALAATAATGYHLIAYNPSMSGYAEQRNASLYMPGDYSVMGKYGNIVETITVEIVGSSRDDMFVKLRALYRAIENARDWVQFPNQRQPSYLSHKPDSTTNTSYSCILGGRVDIPGTDANITSGAGGEGETLSNVMTGIIITIEREPFWRSGAPETTYAGATAVINGTTTDNPWGSFDLSTIPGDVPAPTFIQVGRNAALLSTLWIGYASSARKGAGYNAAGLYEGESGTMGTNMSAVVDATASPGGAGNTKAQCTFGTATNQKRLTISTTPGYGVFRVFMRCQLSAAGSVTMYVSAKSAVHALAAEVANDPVTITHTAWRMIDLGLVTLPMESRLAVYSSSDARSIILYAQRDSGSAKLDVDFLFLLPIDEGVVQVTGASNPGTLSIVYSNMLPGLNSLYGASSNTQPDVAPQWSGSIRPQPGAGYLYVIGGDANFESVWAGSGGAYTWYVKYFAAYLSARGNG